MKENMEKLNQLLIEAASKLDKSARLIAELNLDKVKNRERIADALANIFEIQHQIYELNPELKPDYLKRDVSNGERKFKSAF